MLEEDINPVPKVVQKVKLFGYPSIVSFLTIFTGICILLFYGSEVDPSNDTMALYCIYIALYCTITLYCILCMIILYVSLFRGSFIVEVLFSVKSSLVGIIKFYLPKTLLNPSTMHSFRTSLPSRVLNGTLQSEKKPLVIEV